MTFCSSRLGFHKFKPQSCAELSRFIGKTVGKHRAQGRVNISFWAKEGGVHSVLMLGLFCYQLFCDLKQCSEFFDCCCWFTKHPDLDADCSLVKNCYFSLLESNLTFSIFNSNGANFTFQSVSIQIRISIVAVSMLLGGFFVFVSLKFGIAVLEYSHLSHWAWFLWVPFCDKYITTQSQTTGKYPYKHQLIIS